MINWEAVPAAGAADVASLHWDPSAVPTAGASLTRSASGTTYEALLDRLRGRRDYAASWIEIRRSFRSEDQQQLQAVRLVSRVLAEFVARCDGAAAMAACSPPLRSDIKALRKCERVLKRVQEVESANLAGQ